MREINQEQIDQLGEIVNIGAGNASTALSHMLGNKIDMSVPETLVGNVEDVHNKIGTSDELVVNVFLKLYGDLDGALLMIFKEESALHFAKSLTKNERSSLKDMDEHDTSALQEVGNILLGASTTALSKFLDLNILHSVPDVVIDMLGSSLDEALVEITDEEDRILLFNVDLILEEQNIRGHMYFAFDAKSTDILLSKTAKILEK